MSSVTTTFMELPGTGTRDLTGRRHPVSTTASSTAVRKTPTGEYLWLALIALFRPTSQISDPAPVIFNCKPERHRRVHCIWLVGRHIHRLHQNSMPAIVPPTPAAIAPKSARVNGFAVALKPLPRVRPNKEGRAGNKTITTRSHACRLPRASEARRGHRLCNR